MAITESLNTANDQTIKLVTSVQESILDATKTYLAAVAKATPETPAWAAQDLGELPDTKDLIEQTFAFQARLLEANKTFTLSLSELYSGAAVPKVGGAKAGRSKTSATS